MKAYLALMFCKPEDVRSYGREVADAIKSVAGSNMKYGEGGASITATAFVTEAHEKKVMAAFAPLWRPEQRTWVIRLDGLLIDKALMDWVRKLA